MAGFGARWFSLTLMHRMKDLNARQVEETLTELGASRAELRAAHAQWMQMAYSRRAPKGPAAFRTVLGPPLESGPMPFGDLDCEVARWRLPIWPDLLYELLIGPDGSVWNQWFIRPGAPKEIDFPGLAPWVGVISDVAASFPGAEPVEGAAPQHWGVDFVHDAQRYRSRFIYGLLQVVRPLTEG